MSEGSLTLRAQVILIPEQRVEACDRAANQSNVYPKTYLCTGNLKCEAKQNGKCRKNKAGTEGADQKPHKAPVGLSDQNRAAEHRGKRHRKDEDLHEENRLTDVPGVIAESTPLLGIAIELNSDPRHQQACQAEQSSDVDYFFLELHSAEQAENFFKHQTDDTKIPAVFHVGPHNW